MIGDLWRTVIGKYGYGTLAWGLLIITSFLGLMTYKRALKFAARQKAREGDGSLPFPGAPQ